MATDVIAATCSLRVANGDLKQNHNPGAVLIDQAVAAGPAPGFVSVGFAAEEVISFSELSTLGPIMITNLGPTNYVTFGPESAGAMVAAVRINAGETWMFRLVPGVTYRAQAATAACGVLFLAYNN
jgi:hypothetical protein